MKYLGIDYGTKHIGIAISDSEGGFAFPKNVVPNDAKALAMIARMTEEERVGSVVMGDTLSHNGEPNEITKKADKFASDLEAVVKVPLHRVREAWSSQEAARFAPQGQKHDDSASAAIILQRFLDANKNKE